MSASLFATLSFLKLFLVSWVFYWCKETGLVGNLSLRRHQHRESIYSRSWPPGYFILHFYIVLQSIPKTCGKGYQTHSIYTCRESECAGITSHVFNYSPLFPMRIIDSFVFPILASSTKCFSVAPPGRTKTKPRCRKSRQLSCRHSRLLLSSRAMS